jgi:hypothetical protein
LKAIDQTLLFCMFLDDKEKWRVMSKTFSATASHDVPSSRVGACLEKSLLPSCAWVYYLKKKIGDYIEPLIFSLVKWLSSIKLTHYQEKIIQLQEMSDVKILKCLVLSKEFKEV